MTNNLTTIHYIGNDATLDDLFTMLSVEPLDRDFIFTGSEILPSGAVKITGNFLRVSFVFSLETRDQELLARFGQALQQNKGIDEDEEANPIGDAAKRILFGGAT